MMNLDLTNNELDRLCAEAQGWERIGQLNTGEWVGEKVASGLAWDELCEIPNFTTDKAQATTLLTKLQEKHDVLLEHYNDMHYVECTNKAYENVFEGKDSVFIVAIVKAFILSKQEAGL